MIRDGDAAVELVETELSDDEVWGRAKAGQGALYRRDSL